MELNISFKKLISAIHEVKIIDEIVSQAFAIGMNKIVKDVMRKIKVMCNRAIPKLKRFGTLV